jgi:hypothetical protein
MAINVAKRWIEKSERIGIMWLREKVFRSIKARGNSHK